MYIYMEKINIYNRLFENVTKAREKRSKGKVSKAIKLHASSRSTFRSFSRFYDARIRRLRLDPSEIASSII